MRYKFDTGHLIFQWCTFSGLCSQKYL